MRICIVLAIVIFSAPAGFADNSRHGESGVITATATVTRPLGMVTLTPRLIDRQTPLLSSSYVLLSPRMNGVLIEIDGRAIFLSSLARPIGTDDFLRLFPAHSAKPRVVTLIYTEN